MVTVVSGDTMNQRRSIDMCLGAIVLYRYGRPTRETLLFIARKLPFLINMTTYQGLHKKIF